MKVITVLSVTILFFGTALAQEAAPSRFYKSLSASINAHKVDSISKYPGLVFSILIKTNANGEITSFRENDTIDSALRALVNYAEAHLDKKSLVESNLRGKALLIPIVLLNCLPPEQPGKVPIKQDLNIWAFKGENLELVKLLDPLIVQYNLTKAKGIIN
jgi:hypothetical protein